MGEARRPRNRQAVVDGVRGSFVARGARARPTAKLLGVALALVALLAAARGGGLWAAVHDLRASPGNPEGLRLLAYRVRHDAPDHLALEVKYAYDGARPEPLFVGATTSDRGRYAGHWAYRPDPVRPGVHWARVLLTLGAEAPPAHRTTAIDFKIYVGGGATLSRATAIYPKEWLKSEGPLRCHRIWGRGCGE